MKKKVTQFRYFGDKTILYQNNADQEISIYQLHTNQPNTLTKNDLVQGTIFTNYMPIIQLGIQSLPGTMFFLNTNLDPIIIGGNGIYELDLTNSSAVITSLTFDAKSLQFINDNPDGYLIIDIMYQEE